jgi:predicted transcriptional regulator
LNSAKGIISECIDLIPKTDRSLSRSELRGKCIDCIDLLVIRDLHMILICFVCFLRFDKLGSQTINDLKDN